MEELIVKLVRDNMVAVIYSPGFGAGWYSWNYGTPQILFDPTIVEMIEEGETVENIHAYCAERYPDAYLNCDDLLVRWLPVGTAFRIHEYDGAESVEVRDEMEWIIA